MTPIPAIAPAKTVDNRFQRLTKAAPESLIINENNNFVVLCGFNRLVRHLIGLKRRTDMNKTAEYVSLGHPDKIADYISSALLDECIKQDSGVRYAVEVMVKNNHIILGGEISGNIDLHNLPDYVRQA